MANVQMPTYRGTTTYCNSIAKADGNLLFDTTTKDIYMDVGTGTNDRIKFTTKTTSLAASAVTFNNSGTGMSATKVQDAITELNSNLNSKNVQTLSTGHGIAVRYTVVSGNVKMIEFEGTLDQTLNANVGYNMGQFPTTITGFKNYINFIEYNNTCIGRFYIDQNNEMIISFVQTLQQGSNIWGRTMWI